ncbi:MAG TPA: DnaB-like helicase N-terminal domain-containing protein [Ferrovibrio sp.]|uniref:replicative DNA helicase n=1 Tax=Ferrovibrio sp. TaxID=1917215 RepID=UPI002ED25CC2
MRGETERRVLPHNYEAEQALLAAILNANDVLAKVAGIVRPEDFADAVHGRIFDAALKLILSGRTANALTLKDQFDRDPALDAVGGAAYLARLQASVVTIFNADDYARTIRDLADRRRIIEACERRMSEAYNVNLDKPAATIAAEMAGDLTGQITGPDDGFVSIADLAERVVADLDRDLRCDSTGLAALDQALAGGLYAEKLYGLGGRMKSFKTMLMATIAYNLNWAGVPALYISLEMSPDEQTQRILGRMMGVNSLAFLDPKHRRAPQFADDAVKAVQRLRERANNLLFLQRGRMTRDALRQAIARAALVYRVRGVFVDYLQLISDQRRGESKAEFLDDLAQMLAEATKQYGIWIVAGAQLNQEGNIRGGEGLLMAADVALKVHKIDVIDGPDQAWIEMPYSRYTPLCDIGSHAKPAFELDVKGGPHLREIDYPPEALDELPPGDHPNERLI